MSAAVPIGEDAGAIAPAPPSRAWLTVALLVLLGIVAFLDRQVISLLVGPIKAALDLSDTQISLLQGLAFGILYATCTVPIGYAVDRYSRRLVIFFGVLIWGLSASACGLVTSFSGLLFARVFVGMGEATLAPASYSILSDLFDRRRLSLAISVYSIGSSIGAASALVIGGYLIVWVGGGLHLPLIGALAPWRSVLFLTGLPGLAFCFLVFLMPEPRRGHSVLAGTGDESLGWGALFAFLADRKAFFGAHLSGFACMMAMAYAGLSWMPSVLIRGFGWSIGDVGLALGSVTVASGIGGLLLNGLVVDGLFARGYRDAHLRYYVFTTPVVALFGLAAGFAPHPAAYLLLSIPALLFVNFAGVSAAAVQIVTPSALRGKMSALYLMIVSLSGLIVGPSSVALVTDHVVGTAHVQLALAIVYAVLAPIAGLCFAFGLGPMRRAVERAG